MSDAPQMKIAQVPRWFYPVLLLLGVPSMAWVLFGPRGIRVELEAKTWQRDIEIERLVLETSTGWCDALPADASDVQRRMVQDPEGKRGLAEHCRYQSPQWRQRNIARREGADPAAPAWPEPDLAEMPLGELGAERRGKRQERYELVLRDADDRRWTCEMPLPRWQAHRRGERFRLLVDRFGVADCSSVPIPD